MSKFPGDPSKGMGIHPRPQKGHPPRQGNEQFGRNCQMALPVAVVMTLFYAIPRMMWDLKQGKRIV